MQVAFVSVHKGLTFVSQQKSMETRNGLLLPKPSHFNTFANSLIVFRGIGHHYVTVLKESSALNLFFLNVRKCPSGKIKERFPLCMNISVMNIGNITFYAKFVSRITRCSQKSEYVSIGFAGPVTRNFTDLCSFKTLTVTKPRQPFPTGEKLLHGGGFDGLLFSDEFILCGD